MTASKHMQLLFSISIQHRRAGQALTAKTQYRAIYWWHDGKGTILLWDYPPTRDTKKSELLMIQHQQWDLQAIVMFLVHSSCNHSSYMQTKHRFCLPWRSLQPLCRYISLPTLWAVVSQFGKLFLSRDYVCFSNSSLVSEWWVMEWIENNDSGNLGKQIDYSVIFCIQFQVQYCLLLLCAKASHDSASSTNLNNCNWMAHIWPTAMTALYWTFRFCMYCIYMHVQTVTRITIAIMSVQTALLLYNLRL